MQQYKNYKGPANEQATQKHRGLLSAADKLKLDNILAGASRLATQALDGLMAAADKATLDAIGTVMTSNLASNQAVAATTVTVVTPSIALPVGTWEVYARANVLMGAGAGTADVYLRVNLGAQSPATFPLAAGEQGGGPIPSAVVVVASGTSSVDLACYSSAACTVRQTGGAGGFTNVTGIYAIRRR